MHMRVLEMETQLDVEASSSNEIVREKVICCSDGCVTEEEDEASYSANFVDWKNSEMKVSDPVWPSFLIHGFQKVIDAADWAGERLANLFGITDSKFDIYLWQHEYESRKQSDMEENTFIIDPVPSSSHSGSDNNGICLEDQTEKDSK